LFQLINQTPSWVFGIFFILLILGFIQRKERTVKVKTIFILPAVMVALSLFGVQSAFQLSLLTIGLWGIGLASTLIIGLKLAYPKLVSYSVLNNKLTIPGSWIPLLFMMAIFFTKYFAGFAIARELPLINEPLFVILLCLLYGIFSGIFLSRTIVMYKAISDKR
jgi:hypothetical protein